MSDTSRFLEGAAPLLVDEMKEQAVKLAKDANAALNGMSDAMGLTPKVQESPYGMLGAALGVGYVLGGGLFTPTTMRILALGAKLASVPVVRDQLLDVAESVVDGLLEKTKSAK